MATKKNKKKMPAKSKKVLRKKATPEKKTKNTKAKKAKKKTPLKKATSGKTAAKNNRVRGKSEVGANVAFEPEGRRARSGGQAGDLQGLASEAGSDSESVDELLEEGNAFEAEVVKGVQDAPDADESEVVTHEVPEDDVPGEYEDKDR